MSSVTWAKNENFVMIFHLGDLVVDHDAAADVGHAALDHALDEDAAQVLCKENIFHPNLFFPIFPAVKNIVFNSLLSLSLSLSLTLTLSLSRPPSLTLSLSLSIYLSICLTLSFFLFLKHSNIPQIYHCLTLPPIGLSVTEVTEVNFSLFQNHQLVWSTTKICQSAIFAKKNCRWSQLQFSLIFFMRCEKQF